MHTIPQNTIGFNYKYYWQMYVRYGRIIVSTSNMFTNDHITCWNWMGENTSSIDNRKAPLASKQILTPTAPNT